MLPPAIFMKGASGTLVAARHFSTWMLGGYPGAAAAPAAGIGGENLSAPVVGQIPFTNPSSGNSYLAYLAANSGVAGMMMLCDRIWQNSGIDVTLTTEQVFTGSAQIGARDVNGSNAGVGVMAGVEVITATGAGTPTLTLKYTDQAGNAGHTATNMVPTVASSIAGTFHVIGLAAGDSGIRKAESLQLSATWTTGTLSVVLFRIMAMLPIAIANLPNAFDGVSLGFPRIYNNTVPFIVYLPYTTLSSIILGQAVWSQG
jgi:hypothetical protein